MCRLLLLTSLRELRKEGVGAVRSNGTTRDVVRYRHSLLKSLLIYSKSKSLNLEIVGVLCDDVDCSWMADFPNELPIESVPSADYLRRRALGCAETANSRNLFEERLLEKLLGYRADVAVLDSFMIILSEQFLRRVPCRMLNVHPGITDPNDPGQAIGRFPTRDAFTKSQFGWRILPSGAGAGHRKETIEVLWGGKMQRAEPTAQVGRTGVTVHEVAPEVDAGPTIAASTFNFVPGTMSEEMIREINYDLKVPTLVSALRCLRLLPS